MLASLVGQSGAVSSVQEVKHYGTRAKVEGNVLPDSCAAMAMDFQLFKSPPLDFAHPNEGAVELLAQALRIRPQNASDNLSQVPQVRDVINLQIRGWRHGSSILSTCNVLASVYGISLVTDPLRLHFWSGGSEEILCVFAAPPRAKWGLRVMLIPSI
jgi:hypothetical protein